MSFGQAIWRIKNQLFPSSSSYIKRLKKRGAVIGDGCMLHCPSMTTIDETDPHLLTIGDNVQITGPSTILTHDFSWCVIKGVTGEIFGNQRPVTIGNNVFIGWGVTILCGTTIEDNVIIGAGSVVSGHLCRDSVYAGIPAKKICSLEEYRVKRKAAQISEAQEYVRQFRNRFNRNPQENEITEYFSLFANPGQLMQVHLAQLNLQNNYALSIEKLESSVKPFESFDSFLESC